MNEVLSRFGLSARRFFPARLPARRAVVPDLAGDLGWRHRQPHRNKPIFCHSQIAAHILPAQFLGESHQHRPVRTLAHILGGFLGCSAMAATAADKGAHVNQVFTRFLSAHAGDQRRIPRNCDVVTSRVSSRDKAGIKSVWGLSESAFFDCSLGA